MAHDPRDPRDPRDPHQPPPAAPANPVVEADLHGLVDGQLTPERRAEVRAHLEQHPQQAAMVRLWQADSLALKLKLDAVLQEPLPDRLVQRPAAAAAGPGPAPFGPLRQGWQQAAACAALVVLAAGGGWWARGLQGAQSATAPTAAPAGVKAGTGAGTPAGATPLPVFAQRAAVAHAVYSPEVRRPVEVAGDQEQQLVTWLSKRMGVAIKAPALAPLGYQLVGGRLLPGESAAVAQFMYQDSAGQRLTLYVTREVPALAGQPNTAFQFGEVGATQVFYWVDGGFGYALSGTTNRATLQRVSAEVYRQLAPR